MQLSPPKMPVWSVYPFPYLNNYCLFFIIIQIISNSLQMGFTGFAFAHEMYHQVQFAFGLKGMTTGYIEDIRRVAAELVVLFIFISETKKKKYLEKYCSEHQRAEQCVIDHYARVCSRFNEVIISILLIVSIFKKNLVFLVILGLSVNSATKFAN